MALTKCKECGHELSKKAETCPNCGAPVKSKPREYGLGSLIVFGLFAWFIYAIVTPDEPAKPKPPKTAAQIRQEKIESCFSAWDGSHIALERQIKHSMNDPDSYEHVETRYSDNGDHLIVRTTFRGKNAFGGVVANAVTAKTGLDCNVLQIISQEP